MNLKEKYQNLKTPQELSEFLNQNIKYGWIGKDDNIRIKTIIDFRSQFHLSSLDQILESGVGTCFEQVELARSFFDRNNIWFKSYAVMGGRMIHTFIVFFINGLYYKLENADFRRSGIFEYNTLEELLKQEVLHFMEYRKIKTLDKVNLIEYSRLTDFIDFNVILETFLYGENKNLIDDIFGEKLIK